MRPVLGLDIGGANLKMAHTNGKAWTQPFELWKHPRELPSTLHRLIAAAPASEQVAVTMTGELCDCFETKHHGVQAILDIVEMGCPGQRLSIWRTDGQFVNLRTARQTPYQVAAGNWLALATFAGRFVKQGEALLMDVGSTTTDIVGIRYGVPVPQGRTDTERLRSGELVYRGVRRTPLMACVHEQVAAELFATLLDAFLVLGDIPEDAEERQTADGRPATKSLAHARLARMLGGDAETCAQAETLQLAQSAKSAVVEEIGAAIKQVASRLPAAPNGVVLSGSGEFFARQLVQRQGWNPVPVIVSLAEQFNPALSSAACAYAVAVLAAERGDGH